MAASLTQFFMLFIGNQRAVYIHRNLPAKRIIEPIVFWGGRQIFIASYHMGDPHQMIIHHIGKVVCGVPVRFNQNHIIQLRILHGDVSIDFVMKCSDPFCWVILTDHIGLSCC